MARFTKALRQQIVEDFARQNNGWFDKRAFLVHVRETGPDHPAYEWFEWDDTAAAEAYRLEQAGAFVRDLKIEFKVESIKSAPVTVSAPQFVSPVATRRSGGGYFQTDPQDDIHMDELSRQAARDFAWVLNRYEAVIVRAGGNMKTLRALQLKLDVAKGADAA